MNPPPVTPAVRDHGRPAFGRMNGRRTPLRILLVEDSEEDARVLLEALRRGGYEPSYRLVRTREAMEDALQEHEWEVAIVDYSVPGFGGLAAISLLKARGVDLPIVVISGIAGEEPAVEAMRAGAHDYVTKNNLSRLIPIIQRELAAREDRRGRARAEATAVRLSAIHRVTEAARWKTAVESILAPVIEHTPARLALLDRDFNIVMVNSAYVAASGHSEDQLIGRNYFALYPNDSTRELFQEVRDSGKPYHAIERPIEHAAGPNRDISYSNFTLAPIADKGGAVEALVLSLVDVTPQVRERKQVEELAEEANRRLAELDATIVSIADAVFIFNPEGEISRVNPAAEAIMGFGSTGETRSYADWLAELCFETPAGRVLSPGEMPGNRAFRGETITGELLVIRWPDGRTLWVAASAAPIEARAGKTLGAVVTFTDLTALRQLQEQQEDLVRAISHDLRSPLTVVLGHGQILYQALSRGKINLRRRSSADAIILAARQMNSMIRNLADSARMEAGELELNMSAIEIPALVLDIKERLAEILDVHRVRVEAAEGLPPVLADPDRLERILTNLLTNALKYSDPNTDVTARISLQGEQVVTSVSDHGEGIPAEEISRLFQRYGRTQQSRHRQDSLGLGLYITKGLVEAHGGTIWVKSEVGKGSTFCFSLPAAG